jgi:hypothetical protein
MLEPLPTRAQAGALELAAAVDEEKPFGCRAGPPAAKLAVIAGTGTNGVAVQGPATATPLSDPYGVAVDAAGNVYIADANNNRIEKVTPSGALTFVAGNGAYGTPAAGPALSSPMDFPPDVAVDSTGALYIVQHYDSQIDKVVNGTLSRYAGTGTAGGPPIPGPATSSPEDEPYGVAVDAAGDVFIADSLNNVVEKVTPAGVLSIVAGTGTQGTPTPGPATSSRLHAPNQVAVDGSGNLYITDSTNNVIEKVNTQGILSIFAGTGTAGTSTPGGLATASRLSAPYGVGVDAAGDVYIADTGNNQIDEVNTAGVLSLVAGTGLAGSPTPGPAVDSKLIYPSAVAVGPTGNVYIADEGNNEVEEVAAATTVPVFTADSPPTAVAGTAYTYHFAASGAPAPTFTVASGTQPAGLTLNAATGVLSGTPTASGTFTVTATNSAGAVTTPSITVTVTSAVTTPTPVAPEATAGDSSVVASWTEPSPSTGITGYTASASPGPATCSTTSASATSCVLGAVAGTSYTVTVVTHSSTGADSAASVPLGAVTATSPVVPVVAPLSAPTTLSTSGGPVTSIVPSQPVTVVGTGFAPYSTATVIIYSDPTVLASVTTNGLGDFSAPVTVPVGLQFGEHNFVASGVDPAGQSHVLRLPVTISAAAAAATASHVIAIADNTGGHFLATAIGNVYNYGTKFWGSPHIRHIALVGPVVGIAPTARGGYVEATAVGNVYNYRTTFHGSPLVKHVKLTSAVVGIATTAKGGYLVATAGGNVYNYGTPFHGSLPSKHLALTSPIVGIAATANGGYVLTSAAGNVYAFGTASHGSPVAKHVTLTSPIVGFAATANGGYLLATAAGNVYAYGTRFGGAPHAKITAPVSGIAAANGVYRLTTTAGTVYTYRS